MAKKTTEFSYDINGLIPQPDELFLQAHLPQFGRFEVAQQAFEARALPRRKKIQLFFLP